MWKALRWNESPSMPSSIIPSFLRYIQKRELAKKCWVIVKTMAAWKKWYREWPFCTFLHFRIPPCLYLILLSLWRRWRYNSLVAISMGSSLMVFDMSIGGFTLVPALLQSTVSFPQSAWAEHSTFYCISFPLGHQTFTWNKEILLWGNTKIFVLSLVGKKF